MNEESRSRERQLAPEHPHSSPSSLALDLDELEEDRLRELEQQLISCPECLASLEALVCWLDALDHWDPRVGPEFVVRHHLMAHLLLSDESPRRRLARLVLDDRYHSWGLCRLLLEESRQVGPHSRSHSFELAELTQAIAESLDPSFYGPDWVADLRAETAAHLAMLHRQQRRSDEAGRLFRLACTSLAAGTGRAEIARRVRDAQSLLMRDNPRRGIPMEPWPFPDSENPDPDESDLPRPVHQFLERCRAALENR